MTTLGELAQTLGGVIHTTYREQWLDTKVGELRAVVICRQGRDTVTYDIGVYMPGARELDPTSPPTNVVLADSRNLMPRLRHGYVFIGSRRGVLYATPVAPPSLERVVATLWELVEWARAPLSMPMNIDDTAWRTFQARRDAEQWRDRWRRRLSRLGFVAGVVVAVAVFRRFR